LNILKFIVIYITSSVCNQNVDRSKTKKALLSI